MYAYCERLMFINFFVIVYFVESFEMCILVPEERHSDNLTFEEVVNIYSILSNDGGQSKQITVE